MKNHHRNFGFFLILCSFFVSCTQKDYANTKSIKGFYAEADTLVFSDEHSEIILGRVQDISTGPDNTVYILDSSAKSVKIFRQDGSFLSEMLAGEGRGPGETINPNSIWVDPTGNLYVTDSSQNKVLVLNRENQVIAEAVLSMRPSKVVAQNPDTLYVTGFRFSFSGNLIHQYVRVNNHEYKLSATFAERGEDGESRAVSFSGWSDQLSLDSEGNIYAGRFYPYHIDIFNSDNRLITSIKKESEFITRPAFNQGTGVVTVTGVVREPLPIADGRLLVRYFKMDEAQNTENYFDLYNHQGEIMETVSFKELGINENVTLLASDPRSNVIYAAFNDPYPGVIRYSLYFD